MEKSWTFIPLIERHDPRKLVEAIEFELNIKITSETTLLFFDEIHAVPSLMGMLRYFYEELQAIPVIATGSLLEFTLSAPAFSLPVGRIELYYMNPFSFHCPEAAWLGPSDILCV